MCKKIIKIEPGEKIVTLTFDDGSYKWKDNHKSYRKTIEMIKENGADSIEVVVLGMFDFDEHDPHLVSYWSKIDKIANKAGYSNNVKPIPWVAKSGAKHLLLEGNIIRSKPRETALRIE